MGAYANPQEIEGQFDFTQEQKSYQRLFDTVTASAAKNSERLTELYEARAKKNAALVAEQREEQNKMNQLKMQGDIKNKTGLNMKCWERAIARHNELIALPNRTYEQTQELNEIKASTGVYAAGFGITANITEEAEKSMTYEEGKSGAIDYYGTPPKLLYATYALINRDESKVNFEFGTNKAANRTSWITPVIEINGYDKNVEEKFRGQFGSIVKDPENDGNSWDLQSLHQNFTKGRPYGIVKIPDISKNIKKIQDQNAVQPGGGGIFKMNDKGVWTGEVDDQFLNTNVRSTKVITGDGSKGVTRVETALVNKKAIFDNKNFNDVTNSTVGGFMQNPNDVASAYNHFTRKSIQAQKEAGWKIKKKGENEERLLEDYEKYQDLGEGEGGFLGYNKSDLELYKDRLAHNQKADVINSIEDYQPIGKPYYVGPTALALENREGGILPTGPTEGVWKKINSKVKKDLKAGETDEIDFSVPDDKSYYRIKVTKTKNGGFQFKVTNRYENEPNQK